jgi:hypothetical protein
MAAGGGRWLQVAAAGKETAMAPRVNSELLLVGSLPASTTDTALRSAAGFFGDLVFGLPDGETGPRSAWVGYERERLVRPNPGVVVVQETESPTGIPRLLGSEVS